MSKKGLTFEEKRKRLAEIFYEKLEFYQLKELERIAPRQKGIVVQSVKEVLQSLVDDYLVDSEKIGTSIYFWAFPSKALQTRQHRIEVLKVDLDKQLKIKSDLQLQVKQETSNRQDTPERTRLLADLVSLANERQRLQKQLALYRESDPVIIEAKRNAIQEAISAANRWTDNLYIVQQYCTNRFNISCADFQKQFEIPEEIDTVDEKWLLLPPKPASKRSYIEQEENQGDFDSYAHPHNENNEYDEDPMAKRGCASDPYEMDRDAEKENMPACETYDD